MPSVEFPKILDTGILYDACFTPKSSSSEVLSLLGSTRSPFFEDVSFLPESNLDAAPGLVM